MGGTSWILDIACETKFWIMHRSRFNLTFALLGYGLFESQVDTQTLTRRRGQQLTLSKCIAFYIRLPNHAYGQFSAEVKLGAWPKCRSTYCDQRHSSSSKTRLHLQRDRAT